METDRIATIRPTRNRLWRSSPFLTAAAMVMLMALALSIAGLVFDQRSITGAPAWLKPAKFAISTAIYMLSLAWISTYLTAWPRLTRHADRWLATILVVEVAGVVLQAARGVTSHFNTATSFDATVFAGMGVMILVVWGWSIALTVAAFRQRFADRSLGWAIRLGLLVSVLGAAIGGLMTQPTNAQLTSMRETHQMPITGAHTVGGPDGGPGLPVTKWSLDHGDLRVPHFLGLHALQFLPLLALMMGRVAWPDARRSRGIVFAALSYAALVGILLTQALMGQPIVAPGSSTLFALGVWLVASILGFVIIGIPGRSSATPGVPARVML